MKTEAVPIYLRMNNLPLRGGHRHIAPWFLLLWWGKSKDDNDRKMICYHSIDSIYISRPALHRCVDARKILKSHRIAPKKKKGKQKTAKNKNI